LQVQIRAGYDMAFQCDQETAMVLMLSIDPARSGELVTEHRIQFSTDVQARDYVDMFGNTCTRITAPPGLLEIRNDFVIGDSGLPDEVAPGARQVPVAELPDEVLVYLLGSRYCETDRLSDVAWKLFEKTTPGWARVQAICDFVHNHIAFGYEHARSTMTAWEVFNEGKGVCRDYAHLAITFCRCMNIPARYCTGYLGDIGMPLPWAAGDFAGWFEAYIGGHWYTFDARNNIPRIGRVLIAQGRDASDVPITQTFGPNTLASFKVWTDEVVESSD
jgi:transglutaminase-like putative cysteine protease